MLVWVLPPHANAVQTRAADIPLGHTLGRKVIPIMNKVSVL